MKVAFVILNYNTYQETVECINSIQKKIDVDDYVIVIVDNCSSDDSYLKLQEKYALDKKITLIKTDNNLGFARGNNVGIEYVRRNYESEYVIVLNSDTELIQNDLTKKIEEEYKRSRFALMGPLILTADGRCDNSPHPKPVIANVEKEIKKFKVEKLIISIGFYGLYCAFSKIMKILKAKVNPQNYPIHRNLDFYVRQENVVLQGCFLVFSSHCFDRIRGFDERTFLYYEEPILYIELMKNKMKTVYNPSIVIYHKDGRATKVIGNKSKSRLLFIKDCLIQSAYILLDILKEM